jgi:hypothetical protein
MHIVIGVGGDVCQCVLGWAVHTWAPHACVPVSLALGPVLLPLQGSLFPPLIPTETVLMGLLCPGAQESV